MSIPIAIPSQIKDFLGHIDKHPVADLFVLSEFEKHSGLPRSYAVIVAGIVYLATVFSNVGGIGELLSNISGFLVPAYYSLHALGTSTTKDDTQLLTYWVVFAFLNVIEFWSSAILYWIPFYWLFKTIGLLFLATPSTGAADLVYTNILHPLAHKHVIPQLKEE
ncbi:protein Yop1p [[Candida] railenensis]|uniref:Protein YOP1 n=1 Tax=[Candida] railenensis TaxID=45579 RepID=A0A9P0QTC0_9ASCO|nr:protein Yop1p [[Candida] railenensis]